MVNLNFSSSGSTSDQNYVLLATAKIEIQDSYGNWKIFRALCDSGSQVNAITRNCCDILKLKARRYNKQLAGIGGDVNITSTASTFINVRSTFESSIVLFQESVSILTKITHVTPSVAVDRNKWPHISGLVLADPTFHEPGHVDVLIGAGLLSKIIEGEIIPGRNGAPMAQKTKFGYIIFGETTETSSSVKNCNLISNTQLDLSLTKFWEVDEVNIERTRSADDNLCEEIFKNTHYRTKHGRYVGYILFKSELQQLGDSRERALKQFFALESKFKINPELHEKYSDFMKEYSELKHMIPVSNQHNKTTVYYIPHHAVTTHKFRVVFNGSAKTTSGVSYNDLQLSGEKLQDDLVQIIIRFRVCVIAISADIVKMFRQVLINPTQWNYQRIFWRFNFTDPLEEWVLTTVTYGTTSAPYLAIRSVKQCAIDHRKEYPNAFKIVDKNSYVDDQLFGAHSLESAIELVDELITMLGKGEFELSKWKTNNIKLTKLLNSDDENMVDINDNEVTSVLGLKWSPRTDHLFFRIQFLLEKSITKRTVLSQVAKLYDPTGYLAPIIIRAKIFIQQLWSRKVAWDEELDQQLQEEWAKYSESLKDVEKIRIPRWFGTTEISGVELHGFCDASNKAYGAVIYTRTINSDGEFTVRLIISKSRVAPLKNLTIARLELEAAKLLARMFKIVSDALKSELHISASHCWTDSMIVMCWISKSSSSWKTFVANRVSEIQTLTSEMQWHHVSSRSNPADIISRGASPEGLISSNLWWVGPDWLRKKSMFWPDSLMTLNLAEKEVIENERKPSLAVVINARPIQPLLVCQSYHLLEKYSTLTTLLRVTAYVLRFISKSRKSSIDNRFCGILSSTELDQAELLWIRYEQQIYFANEIKSCRENKVLFSESKLRGFSPFIDGIGILRVGGRIAKSELSYDEKHPIILPHEGKFTRLLCQNVHEQTLHGGVQLMLQVLRQKYWIVHQRKVVKSIASKCIKCFKQKKRTSHQLMGSLPESRLTINDVFVSTGVDYCGPFQLKRFSGRCNTFTKGYVAVFICMRVKAVHLEMVSDLSTSAFISAFTRFCSRRSGVRELWSDNGTAFVGANREFKEILASWMKIQDSDEFSRYRINWKFIPPASPHQGGLWEAAVKSAKYHMKRVIGNQHLTYEEMETLIVTIEACLNSRPLTPLTDDPNDLTALTPGHFLVGRTIELPLRKDASELPLNHVKRWSLLEKFKWNIWKRWQSEYLTQLNMRSKWVHKTPNIQVGQMVIVKNENLPPAHWRLGRILNVYPDKDNVVRRVDVQHQSGMLRRTVQQLCILPIEI